MRHQRHDRQDRNERGERNERRGMRGSDRFDRDERRSSESPRSSIRERFEREDDYSMDSDRRDRWMDRRDDIRERLSDVRDHIEDYGNREYQGLGNSRFTDNGPGYRSVGEERSHRDAMRNEVREAFGTRRDDDDRRERREDRREEIGRFFGRGPKGFKRSDDRIKEEISELLTRHPEVDASEVEIEVKDGEVTLTGTVIERRMKHLAEDAVERAMGVRDIINNLRVRREEARAESREDRGERREGSSLSPSAQQQAGKKAGASSTTTTTPH
ncbi:BON domain-containing protein [Bdellovibrio sp. HCB337]|uniref:BON domain-containing protein n=1 Tax=Bdellovibrio sp. HCB337 TaxID=3394358 RepID=UPI0039A64A7C